MLIVQTINGHASILLVQQSKCVVMPIAWLLVLLILYVNARVLLCFQWNQGYTELSYFS